MFTALLQTKLYVPPVRPDLVPRPHLIARLNQGLNLGHKLTLVSAPAGYGKTTLVAGWLQETEHQIAWLTLDRQDNDPARFLRCFISALQQVNSGFGETALALLQSPQLPPEAIPTALVNEITAVSTPFVLALDDYHVLQTAAIHEQLTFILDNQPPHMHLAIMTREDPPLPISRWRARGQLIELRQADLCFNTEETADFLQRVMGLDLSADDITALERRTEGWIAGLQLAALSMQGRADLKRFVRALSGSNRYILDYLIEEVFERQPTEVQDFLLNTSVLDRLCAPLCDTVAERTDSHKLLQLLEQTNLFIIPLDQSREWYRYHHLFAELLRHRQRLSGQRPEAALHLKAAHWYEAQGNMAEAVEHALAAKAWPEAQRLIRNALAETIKNGRIATLYGWIDALPEELVEQDCELATAKGWALLMTGQLEAAGTYAGLAEYLMPAEAPPADRGALTALRSSLALAQQDVATAVELSQETLELVGESDLSFVRGMALNNMAQAQMMMGDMPAATETYREMARQSQKDGHSPTTISAMANLAWLLNQQGKRREAVALSQQALDQCVDSRGRRLPLAAYAHISLGLLCYEANDLVQARQHLLRTLEHGAQLGLTTGITLSGKIALARVQQAAGKDEVALATIGEARQIASQMNQPYAVAQAASAEADINLRQGNIALTEGWAEKLGLSPTDRPNHLQEADYLIFGRLLLAQNRPEAANTLLANFEQFAQSGERRRSLITVYILQALAQQALGRGQRAHEYLEKALSLAAAEGYRRAFLDEGQGLMELLPQARQQAPDFVDELLESLQAETDLPIPTSQHQKLREPLSQRELEILQFVADGLSNREIAERAFISQGTVKSHVHHILEKLDVHSRTQAVARARELELL